MVPSDRGFPADTKFASVLALLISYSVGGVSSTTGGVYEA
jgi:hypothetical protein